MMKKRVLDLNSGLGGRVYAFERAGFEIVAAVDKDKENCNIMKSWLEDKKVLNQDLLEMDLNALPDAEIITAKYIQSRKDSIGNDTSKNINMAIYNIISRKNPMVFLLEVPISSILSKQDNLEKYIQMFYEIGYDVSYEIYDEMSFSGYPIKGRQGYIIGYRNSENADLVLPESVHNQKKKMVLESSDKISQWYRKLNFQTSDWEKGYFYLNTYGVIEKSEYIHMGFGKENYLVDEEGPRRFTHNELAVFKGIHDYDYNSQANKSKMYSKIAYATNVYVVEYIACKILSFICQDFKEDVYKKTTMSIAKASKDTKIKENTTNKILFPKKELKEIKINKLKGIKDLSLKFDKNIVALMGVNGSGKSTILHALACSYTPYEKGEDHKFCEFFTPNPDASWAGSSFEIKNFDMNDNKEHTKKYEKKKDRWVRYDSRPKRDVYFLGINSCIPAIELEKKTSFINYKSKELSDKVNEKVVRAASIILNIGYEKLLSHEAGKKTYIGVHNTEGLEYSALSMGAGEQRIIKILQTVYNANQYSLILIDEIDLLLHSEALHKLIKKLSEIAKEKNLQIIFTTHSLEMQNLTEYIDIRYIDHQGGKTLVYNAINPDLLHKMSGEIKKIYSIYVEDVFAEAVVKQIAKELRMLRYISIITYGSIKNAFTLATGKILAKEHTENILIVTDGDVYVSPKDKERELKKLLTGSEDDHDKKIQEALKMIVQFKLPQNKAPEKFIHELLSSMDDSEECVAIAKGIKVVDDNHQWIGKIVETIGVGNETFNTIMNIVSKHEEWAAYVEEVYNWIKNKKDELETNYEKSILN